MTEERHDNHNSATSSREGEQSRQKNEVDRGVHLLRMDDNGETIKHKPEEKRRATGRPKRRRIDRLDKDLIAIELSIHRKTDVDS